MSTGREQLADLLRRRTLDTPWGTLILQSEHTRGEGRWHYVIWHANALLVRPPLGTMGARDARAVARAMLRWLKQAQAGGAP